VNLQKQSLLPASLGNIFLFARTSPAHAAGDVLTVVDGVSITPEKVEKHLVSQHSKLEEQIHNSLPVT